MTMKDYRTVVVGTDGSDFAGSVVARAAWLAVRDDANLVVVCAFAEMPRRTDAKNVRTLGGDPVPGRSSDGRRPDVPSRRPWPRRGPKERPCPPPSWSTGSRRRR
jgi:hypothetical protein